MNYEIFIFFSIKGRLDPVQAQRCDPARRPRRGALISEIKDGKMIIKNMELGAGGANSAGAGLLSRSAADYF